MLTVMADDWTDAVELRLTGELSLATVPGLTERLAEAELAAPSTLLIDLRGVTFMDSSALGVLVRARNRGRRHGCRLVLAVAPGPVARVLAITGLDREFELAL